MCAKMNTELSFVRHLLFHNCPAICRLSLDTKNAGKFGEPHIPEAAAAARTVADIMADDAADSSTGGRSLLQGVNTNDFTCVGCPAGGPDTRTSVPSTASFPYSAIGQLMGQVTSNTCAFFSPPGSAESWIACYCTVLYIKQYRSVKLYMRAFLMVQWMLGCTGSFSGVHTRQGWYLVIETCLEGTFIAAEPWSALAA